MTLHLDNEALLPGLRLFTVSVPETWRLLDMQPFGVPISETFDPLVSRSGEFLELLKRLDVVTFGPEDMGMPRWTFLDCVELSGAIIGLGRPAAEISESMRALLQVPREYRGLVPYSVYMAIPMSEPGVWFGHNLASIAGWVPEESLRGLGSLTKGLALKAYRARAQVGATQWASRALFVHTRMAPLALLSAWTPAHGKSSSLTYRATITDDVLRALIRDRAGRVVRGVPELWIGGDDEDAMRSVQGRIEAGERFAIVGRPERDGERQRVPIARV